jgi:hypothetical protein
MKDTLEHCCALDYADLGDVLARTRKEVRRLGIKVTPEDWQRCIDRDLLALAQDGNTQMAIDKLLDCLTQAASSEAAR